MNDNLAIAARFADECWNKRSRTICRELLAAEYEHYMPGSDQPIIGPDAFQELVDYFLEAFPDTRFAMDNVFGEGRYVCMTWTVHATHTGDFNGIPATHRSIIINGAGVARIVNGVIFRIDCYFDNESFTRQLDAPAERAASSWQRTARQAS